jgi:hypothetical protein
MEFISPSGVIGAVAGAGLVIVGTLWAGRRQFMRQSRLRLAQEIVPKYRERFRAEDWTGATEHLSLLISSAWAVGVRDHQLIDELRAASARLDQDIKEGASLDASKKGVEEAIKVLQQRLHEAILGRTFSSVRRRRTTRRLRQLRKQYQVTDLDSDE